MGFAEMVVSIVFIVSISESVKAFARKGAGKDGKLILNEIKALREEVQQIRRQQNDVILALDGSLDQIHRQLGMPESRLDSAAHAPQPLDYRVGKK